MKDLSKKLGLIIVLLGCGLTLATEENKYETKGELQQKALPSNLTLNKLKEVPVDLVKGIVNFAPRFRDVGLKTRKSHIQIKRNYRSNRTEPSIFGLGWDWNHGEKIIFPTPEDIGTDNAEVLKIKVSSGEYSVFKGLKRYPPIETYPDFPKSNWYKIMGVLPQSWTQIGGWKRVQNASVPYINSSNVENYSMSPDFDPNDYAYWLNWDLPDLGTDMQIVKLKAGWIGHTWARYNYSGAKARAQLGAGVKNWRTSNTGDELFSIEYLPPDGYSWADAKNEKLYIKNSGTVSSPNYQTWVYLVTMSVYYLDNSEEWSVPEGSSYTFSESNSGRDIIYTITFKDKSKSIFDAYGKLITKVDGNGNELDFSYDIDGTLKNITDEVGQSLSFNYTNTTAGLRVDRVAIGNNPLESEHYCDYVYDDDGMLISYFDMEEHETIYSYAPLLDLADDYPANVLTKIEDPEGGESFFSYYLKEGNTEDLWGKIQSYTNAVGTSYKFLYDLSNSIAYCEIEGKQTTGVTYNELHDVTLKFVRDGTFENSESVIQALHDNDEDTIVRYFNNSHNASAKIQAGNKYTFSYDVNNNMTSKTDPLSNTWHYVYHEALNVLVTETNPLGVVTITNVYDDNGNLTNTCNALGRCKKIRYDDFGNMTLVTDAMTNTTTYIYDDNSINIIEIKNSDDESEYYKYDLFGNVTNRIDRENYVFSTKFNKYGKKVWEKTPIAENSYKYDKNYRLIQQVFALGTPDEFSDIVTKYTQVW